MRHYFIQIVVLQQLIAPYSTYVYSPPYVQWMPMTGRARCGPCPSPPSSCLAFANIFSELDAGRLRTSAFPSFLILDYVACNPYKIILEFKYSAFRLMVPWSSKNWTNKQVEPVQGERRKLVIQRLSYPTETVLSNKIARSRIVLSFKDSPRKSLRRWPTDLFTHKMPQSASSTN